MGNYIRVLPRDLFNEADLLKCYGRLWIALDSHPRDHRARFVTEDVPAFEIAQDPSSGAIYLANVEFCVRHVAYRLSRPLNARGSFPLYVEGEENSDFDPVAVFDDAGNLSADMLTFICGEG